MGLKDDFEKNEFLNYSSFPPFIADSYRKGKRKEDSDF